MDWDVTPEIRLSSLTSYTEFDLYTRQDYNRYTPSTNFNTTPNPVNAIGPYDAIYALLFPGGFVDDPQNGNRNRFRRATSRRHSPSSSRRNSVSRPISTGR